MKSIGPYVISAVPAPAARYEPPAEAGPSGTEQAGGGPGANAARSARKGGSAPAGTRASGQSDHAPPVYTAPLHGIDRLTGMPVLLHRLNEFVVPATLPESASLLPVYEVDIWDGQPYAITELPLSARPATHPGAAALGALRALKVLHASGQAHGNVNASQLWQVGQDVQLAGAGLPWSRNGSPAADLAALGQALDSLGARPAALDGLETQSAAQALSALEEALYGQRPAEAVARQPIRPPSSTEPARPEQAQPAANPPTFLEHGAAQTTLAPAQPPLQALSSKAHTSRKAARKQEREARKAVSPALTGQDPTSRAPAAQTSPAQAAPVQEADAPVSYRSAQDIIVIGEPQTGGEQAAGGPPPVPETTGTRVSGPEVQHPASPPARLIPAPIRIGFDDAPALLPDWTPPDLQTPPQVRAAEAPPALPEEGRDRGRADLEEHGGQPDRASLNGNRTAVNLAAVNSVRHQPLRIGWEEDHSWRVVKSGPERRRLQAPALPGRGLPRSLVMALAAVLVLGGAAFWWRGQTGTPADGCCAQTFTVSGSRQAVKVTLVKAPPGSPLAPGGVVGTAPGILKFPDAPGSYTLKFEAAGHSALTGVVTVPSAQAFDIVLK